MGYYLLDHPNPSGNKFYASRGVAKKYVVIHTAENLPDLAPPDLGAESVARYLGTTSRDASCHECVDSDSFVPMLPDNYVAWHCRGYNSTGWGLEICTQAHKWADLPADFRDRLYRAAAARARRAALALKIPLVKTSPGGAPGFFGHTEADPTRRSDPGRDFDWGYFMNLVNEIDVGVTPAPVRPPAPPAVAPGYPLGRCRRHNALMVFGPKSGPDHHVSGYYSHRDDLRRWQERMRGRGWDIGADGLYGPNTEEVCRKFQAEKRLTVDGLIGPNTWRAAWTAPVT